MTIVFDINELATMPSTEQFGRGGLLLRDSLVAQHKTKNYNKENKEPFDLKNFQIKWELCNHLNDLENAPALYKLTMPNNISYIGQSNNVRKRVLEHIFKIIYNKERSYVDARWYYKAHQQFNYKDILLDYFNEVFNSLKIEIFYLSSGYEAMKVEKIVLEEIWNKGRQDSYYNSQFYQTNEKGATKLVKYANPNCE